MMKILNRDAPDSGAVFSTVDSSVLFELEQLVYGKNKHFVYVYEDCPSEVENELINDINESGDYCLEEALIINVSNAHYTKPVLGIEYYETFSL